MGTITVPTGSAHTIFLAKQAGKYSLLTHAPNCTTAPGLHHSNIGLISYPYVYSHTTRRDNMGAEDRRIHSFLFEKTTEKCSASREEGRITAGAGATRPRLTPSQIQAKSLATNAVLLLWFDKENAPGKCRITYCYGLLDLLDLLRLGDVKMVW